jgi:hypothetical protein
VSLEVRELIVKVNVGSTEPVVPASLLPSERAALKRELVEACLAEMKRRTRETAER